MAMTLWHRSASLRTQSMPERSGVRQHKQILRQRCQLKRKGQTGVSSAHESRLCSILGQEMVARAEALAP